MGKNQGLHEIRVVTEELREVEVKSGRITKRGWMVDKESNGAKGETHKAFGQELGGTFHIGMPGKDIVRGAHGQRKTGKGRGKKGASKVLGDGLKGGYTVDNVTKDTGSLLMGGGTLNSGASEEGNGRCMDLVTILNQVEVTDLNGTQSLK
ncbi:hypothetical protein LIER_29389 [Lithospermum erythrorhizon]|uniref:Uncharacterized protein n=1 Tax=Lithospermum erythrorhizon TaxID=34254 RepID=A0AAV3RKQ5_LITER